MASRTKFLTVPTHLDIHGINHIVTALTREMMPGRSQPHPETDVLFMGGGQLSAIDKMALARFGFEKNYNIVFASFDDAVMGGPAAYTFFFTDGVSESSVVEGGRLWKRDARSATVLLFNDDDIMVKLSTKGRLLARPMTAQHHEFGYQMATATLKNRAAAKPGRVPVMSTVRHVPVVLDITTLAGGFAAAA